MIVSGRESVDFASGARCFAISSLIIFLNSSGVVIIRFAIFCLLFKVVFGQNWCQKYR